MKYSDLFIIAIVVGVAWTYFAPESSQSSADEAAEPQGSTLHASVDITRLGPGYEIAVEDAVTALVQTCDSLAHYWPDIESVRATVYADAGDEYAYQTERWGWTDWIHIELKVRNSPVVIPNKYGAWGHTLHYYLGGGGTAGLTAQKEQSYDVCGPPLQGQPEPGFVPIPALATLSDLEFTASP